MTRHIHIDQEVLAAWDVDMEDGAIIDHIQRLSLSEHPKVEKHKHRGRVWIDYSYLLECYPLLRISESTLKRKLYRLKEIGLLDSVTTPLTEGTRKAYYKLTPKYWDRVHSLDNRANLTSEKRSNVKMTREQCQNDTVSSAKLTRNPMVLPEGKPEGSPSPSKEEEELIGTLNQIASSERKKTGEYKRSSLVALSSLEEQTSRAGVLAAWKKLCRDSKKRTVELDWLISQWESDWKEVALQHSPPKKLYTMTLEQRRREVFGEAV
jgi:hypothetical protein